MFKTIRKLLFRRRLPVVGETYSGDAFYFVFAKPVEKILFGMVDIHGDSVWEECSGPDSYRLKILNSAMPYYICDAEVLCHQNFKTYKWLKRSQPRRIGKKVLKDMVTGKELKLLRPQT